MASKLADSVQKIAASVLAKMTNGTMKTGNPDNVSSQITYNDLDGEEQEKLARYLTGTAKIDANKLIDQGEEWFEEARAGRWEHHEDFFTGLAFFAGKQDYYWNQDANGGSGMMQAFPSAEGNSDFEERFTRKYENVFRVMIERAVARITAAYPDAWAAPLTDAEKDKLAAQILRSVNGHCGRATKRDRLIYRVVLNMLLTTTTFIETGWDPKAYADIGIPQPDGSVQYHRAQAGDVRNAFVASIDGYPDPNASLSDLGIHGGAYFIKRHLMNVQDIADKWGREVAATGPGSTFSFLRQRMELIAGDYSRVLSKMKTSAEVTEVWNRPSKQYTQGRFWVYAADRTLLWAGMWPYEKNDKYPFVAVGFAENAGSVWDLNMGKDLMPDQRSLNKLASYLATRVEWDRPTILIPSTSAIAPDDLLNPTLYKNVPYDGPEVGGAEPKFFFPPSPGNFYFQEEQRLIASMERIAGVHDLNADAQTAPDSGYKYELRTQTDKERLAPVIKRVADARVELMEWDGALYRQFGATFPRLLGVDDTAIPTKALQGQNAAATALVDIQALRDGNTRVVIQPGSGEAKLPAAQEDRLMEITQLLVKAPPPLVEWFLNQCQSIRSDQEIDRLVQGLKEYASEQAQQQAATAAGVQQMKGSQAQQQLVMKQQADEAQQQSETAADQAKAAIDVHSQMLIQQFRTQADMAVESQRFQNAMQQLQAKSAMPTVALKGTLSPGGESSAESKSGLAPSDIATITKMLIPPPPMMNSQSKGNANGPTAKN